MSDPSAEGPEAVVVEDEDVLDDDHLDDDVQDEVLWTSDDALSFAEARRLTSRRGATVVLFAGDTSSGKTTAMVEIWTSLLSDGSLGSCTIAGSNNPLAFELRSFDSRVVSGTNTTNRTDEDTEGFLHLGVHGPRGRIEVLFADYVGEHFTHIREGTETIDELPWIGRVDRLAVLVDGAHVASAGSAQVAFTRAQRLMWKLRDCVERNPRLRVAMVLTKAELVDDGRLAAFGDAMKELHNLACELDPEAPVLHIAARPSTGEGPRGLDALLDWIYLEHRNVPPYEPQLERPSRALGRFR